MLQSTAPCTERTRNLTSNGQIQQLHICVAPFAKGITIMLSSDLRCLDLATRVDILRDENVGTSFHLLDALFPGGNP